MSQVSPFVPATEPDANHSSSSRLARVCIVTQEINGPSRNGGIGTAYTALAELLAGAGHDVTVLYLPGPRADGHSFAHWVERYRERRIHLTPLPQPLVPLSGPDYLARSYAAYLWLREQSFDLVHCHEWLGVGYYSLLARRQGLAFAETRFCVGCQSPTLWLEEANQELLASLAEAERDAIERRCVEWADVVWSPSDYLLRWMTEHGWRLPAHRIVRPNLVPDTVSATATSAVSCPVRELVFFGRLETRKGVELFCDALDLLDRESIPTSFAVTFLGKPTLLLDQPADEYVWGRARGWPFPCRLLTDRDHDRAYRYLRRPGRLAVMPSLIDNCPLTVLECLQAQIPFLASAVGGIPELVAEEDHARVLFAPRAAELASRLASALREGIEPAQPALSSEVNATAWRDWHLSIGDTSGPSAIHQAPSGIAKVSVCLVTFNRPAALLQAVESLRRQDYPHFEVVLVDDGSTLPEALACLERLEPEFRERGWKVIRQANRYLGAARNTAARAAAGDYLLFMDDDNIAKPHELSTLVRIAERTGADVVTTLMDFFTRTGPNGEPLLESRWLFSGVTSLAVAVARNCFGDANALVRRAAFDAVGGFTEDHGVTHEDWEFFVRIVLHGLKLELVPEALFWYRLDPRSMIRSTPQVANYRRHLRPILEEVPEPYRELIHLAQGLALRDAARTPASPFSVAEQPVRPLRYEWADAINARLKKLGFLHRLGRRLFAALRHYLGKERHHR